MKTSIWRSIKQWKGMIPALIIICFFAFPLIALADPSDSPMFEGEQKSPKKGDESCVNDHTCIKVCEWSNPGTDGYHAYAYYYFKGNSWKYVWYFEHHPFVTSRSESGGKLPDKNIFYESDSIKNNLQNKGTCPAGAYVDRSGAGLSQELCLDSTKKLKGDKTYCHKKSNMGTSFKDNSKLIYTMDKQINTYFDKYTTEKINSVTCENLADSTGYSVDPNKLDGVLDEVANDFSHNFLYDNKLPEFMKNGAYKNKYKDFGVKIKAKAKTCATQLKKKAEQDLQAGKISQEEYNNITSDEDLDDQIQDKLDDLDQNINEGVNPSNPSEEVPIVDANCETLLGDKITEYLKTGLTYLQIGGIILAIILGMLDFVGAMLSGEADALKKAQKKLVVRIAMAAALLLIPALLKIIFGTFGTVPGSDTFCIL